MWVYHVAVCDDEESTRRRICDLLQQYATEHGIQFQFTHYASANELLKNYSAQFDLLFLDISMDGIDGMTAAREIRKTDPVVGIIFVTSMRQFAIEGYSVHAVGFVAKPFSYSEFSLSVEPALRQIDAQRMSEDTITLSSFGQVNRIRVSDILYCEVANHSLSVHGHSGVSSYRIQMKEAERLLKPYGFFRPHHSFLVNHRAIERIESDSLVLKNGERVPVSQHKRKEFLQELTGYLGGSL